MRFVFAIALAIGLGVLSMPPLQANALVDAARGRIGVTVGYDPSYQRLAFPGGDVADHTGVCSDVVIRAYRIAYGYDLQRAVHDDMRTHFADYPTIWGLTRPDANIDHRRVPNLERFFTRQNARIAQPIAAFAAEDFKPGDIVTWRLNGRLPHIGVVSDALSPAGVPLVIHNIGAGTREEDVLFSYPIVAHFRFHPAGPRR
ncbi:MAG: DUF1287 domain-containing protein [Pseudomonadota bacterium]